MSEFLEQYALTYRFQLGIPGSIKIAPDGKVLFLRSEARSFTNELFELDPKSKEERVLTTAEALLSGAGEELSDVEKARRERMRSTARGIASYALTKDGARVLIPLSGRLFFVERESDKVEEIPVSGHAHSAVLSPDSSKVAYVIDADLYVYDLANAKETRLSTRENEHISYGLPEFVAQEEMSRYRGFWWSPDGAQLAVQRTDTSKMETMHIMDPSSPADSPKAWAYPRPGKANAVVSLGLIPASGGAFKPIDWDRPLYPYLASVTWPSEGGPLTLVVQNRHQTEELVLAVDPATGKTKTLLKERDDAWLNLDQSVPRWIDQGQAMLWVTEKNGGRQLELRSKTGEVLRALNGPSFGLHRLVQVDEAKRRVIVNASRDPKETHIFSLPLDPTQGEPEQLSEAPGMHAAVWSSGTEEWVHTEHRTTGERITQLKDFSGHVLAELKYTAEVPKQLPKVELLEIEGQRIYSAAIVRPRDFQKGERYPVLLSVYAGPGVRKVNSTPYSYVLQQWFADHGFIVVSLDGRGTPGRGRDWERAIKGDFISVPLEDQIDGLQALARRFPELDLDRVGVFGWSFGGYFSALAVMRRPDIFKAGVAGAPVTDWLDYDTHYTERYLGLPGEQAEAYRRSSVLEDAASLERPLLIIHGTADDNVYFSHAVKLSDVLFRAGKHHEFLPLSGFTHMVPDPLVTTRLYTTILEFLRRGLNESSPPS